MTTSEKVETRNATPLEVWSCFLPGNQGSEKKIEVKYGECPCCAYVLKMPIRDGDGWTVSATRLSGESQKILVRHVAVLATDPNVVTACVAAVLHVHENVEWMRR